MSSYTISGRVVDHDGGAVSDATVTIFEIKDLSGGLVQKGSVSLTDGNGQYSISWVESIAPVGAWDVFVRVSHSGVDVESALINDLEGTANVDLVFSTSAYRGRSEWERIGAKLSKYLGATEPEDVPVERLEWLARRADVFPTHLGAYVQAHRLAARRTVDPKTCYACLRAGLPAALPQLLRAGPRAWEHALRNAWLRRILALPGDGSAAAADTELTAQIAALQELVVEAATEVPPVGVTTQRTLFDSANIDPGDQQTFMQTWVTRNGSVSDFWAELTTALAGDAAKVETFQFTIQAATLVANDVAALAGLQIERANNNISTLRDLAAWSEGDWEGFLTTHAVAAPSDVPGANANEQRLAYARALSRVVEDSYPTPWLRHALTRDEAAASAPANTEHVRAFLTNNPDFDITRSTISHYLDGAVAPWQGIDPADEAGARANLERVQRVYRLTPRIGRYATTKILLDNEIGSATEVVSFTREEFRGKFDSLLSSDDHHADALADAIWDQASQVHTMAIGFASHMALGKSGADFMPLGIAGAEQFEQAEGGFAELAEILGSLDYCACERCRSVFSPAAYLADLLAFLAKRPGKQAANALELLDARRPDIRHILLNCANTNTALPYIDLVNELLEAKLAGELTPPGSSHQTTWAAEQLRIHPEHLDHEIYDGSKPPGQPITATVYPWNLPFSLADVGARTYLEHLSVPRAQLLARFSPPSPTDDQVHALAAARLGLNTVEFAIVTGSFSGNASEDGREYWGYVDGVDDDWITRLNGTADPGGDIGELLRRGRYQLDELRAALSLDFVDPSGVISFVWDESCDLSAAQVPALDAATLDRLHRFTRLQRRCQIPARMLNVLLVDVCGGVLNADAAVLVGELVVLERQLGLGWDELATFWSSTIDARSYEGDESSLYARRFLSKELETIGPDALADFEVNGGTLSGELESPEDMSAQQRAVVLAALGLSAAELELLTASSLTSGLASEDFSRTNLGALYRATALARALRLSVEELVALVDLRGELPFATPGATAIFIDELAGLRASGWTIAELDWVLRHQGEGPLDDAQTGRELAGLARGVATIIEATSRLHDPDGEALAINLAQLLTPEALAVTLEIVELRGPLGAAERQQHLTDELGTYLDASAAYEVLVDDESENYEIEFARRRAWLLAQVVSYQRRRALVVDTLAGRFELGAALADALAFSILVSSARVGDLLMAPFADEAEISAELSSASHPDEFDAWTRVAKAALVTQRHQLGASEVAWYSGRGEWLDLDGLPRDDQHPNASFAAWSRLRRALELRSLFDADELVHATIADAGNIADATSVLAEQTGWNATMLASTASTLGYALEDFGQELVLEHLQVVATTAEQLGVDLDTAYGWASAAPNMAQAAAIKSAARAKHDGVAWQRVAAPLRDRIREQQRDALVDAVLATDVSLADPNAVFEHLLVDVEMSACMMSTRIKQAISSVQIFIHRALLHLEADELSFGSEAIGRWEWMKNYRVWEANRKVFLYPENWIEPELRANKTPEFEALEATLMQGVLDQPRVEKALVSYLDQLDRVSNLEIMGVYQRQVGGELWLLGRTAAKPHEWFLRQRRNGGAWQPWQEVPAKIESDAVALIVHERRVHLFWAERNETSSGDDAKAWNYRLSHVERSEDGWSKIVVSDPSAADASDFSRHRLLVWTGGERISLDVLGQHGSGSKVALVGRFEYDTRDQRSQYVGSTYKEYAGWVESLFDFSFLSSPELVGLRAGHKIHGQRHVNDSFALQEGAAFDENYSWSAGTWFEQGEFSAPLFRQRSASDNPAMIHHADLWTPDPSMKFLPVVYDDRQRKYLLSPLPHYENVGTEGNDIDPDALGNLKVDSYWGCPPDDLVVVVPKVIAPVVAAQKLHDGLNEAPLWGNGGVPGQVKGLGKLAGITTQDAAPNQAPMLLKQAEDAAQALDELIDEVDNGYPASPTAFKLRMEALYHPGSRLMVEAMAKQGLRGLFPSSSASPLFRQQTSNDPSGEDQLDLNLDIIEGLPPLEEFDFQFDSPYGLYNWELFFHVPMLIAAKLTAEQRFEEAQRWHHLVFNPIELVDDPQESATSRFWRLKPFVEQAGTLAKDQLEIMLGVGASDAEQSAAIESFTKQVLAWERDPFDPHAVARIRPGVYQRTLLRKYLDNLIAWADSLFRRDSVEAINEATILYVLVAQLLGPRPQAVPGNDSPAQSFDELQDAGLDAFSNAIVQLENLVLLPTKAAGKLGCTPVKDNAQWVRVPVISHFWYFCYPPNAQLLEYWNTIEDRLWKIRHCRNIEGIERQLPLFQAPINPALLVRATAAGVDIQSALAELASGLPPYRFRGVQARAMGFTGSLRSLGSELLAAIEKRDAEQLSRIRAGHELQLLDRVRELRVQQIDEARQAVASLTAARATIEDRRAHYQRLVDGGYSEREERHFELAKKANRWSQAASTHAMIGSILAAFPQVTISASPSVTFGGMHLSNIMSAMTTGMNMVAAQHSYHANKASLTASFNRRAQDWELQRGQSQRELDRIEQDMIAAEIRVEISKQELRNHDLQTEQSRELDRYMRDKFSNRELYDWMVGQLSTLYFQTYQLAFDLAKRAERAYRHELAIPASEAAIIKYGYWDSLRKGLLAGARLNHDLERLELAYMDRNIREFELRKSMSLTELDPAALRELQESGSCSFSLPELLFDLDHPGHYLRRIRSVRLTIPAVVGPYTSLGARLELNTHKTRLSPQATNEDYGDEQVEDRFRFGVGGGEAIATSTAVADGGLFNLDFGDERYLPFEYVGAVSSWKLALPAEVRQFDYRSISDVVVHVDYTARDGGDLREVAEAHAREQMIAAADNLELTQLVVVHDAFPSEWEAFLSAPSVGDQELLLPVDLSLFDYLAQQQGVEVKSLEFALLHQGAVGGEESMVLTASIGAEDLSMAQQEAPYMFGVLNNLSEALGTWTLALADGAAPAGLEDGTRLDRSKVVGMLMIVRYTLLDS